jgi:hypothetical protein
MIEILLVFTCPQDSSGFILNFAICGSRNKPPYPRIVKAHENSMIENTIFP